MASGRKVCLDCYHKGTDFVPDFTLIEPGVWRNEGYQCPMCQSHKVVQAKKWSVPK